MCVQNGHVYSGSDICLKIGINMEIFNLLGQLIIYKEYNKDGNNYILFFCNLKMMLPSIPQSDLNHVTSTAVSFFTIFFMV